MDDFLKLLNSAHKIAVICETPAGSMTSAGEKLSYYVEDGEMEITTDNFDLMLNIVKADFSENGDTIRYGDITYTFDFI